jgi:hypothetical protein
MDGRGDHNDRGNDEHAEQGPVYRPGAGVHRRRHHDQHGTHQRTVPDERAPHERNDHGRRGSDQDGQVLPHPQYQQPAGRQREQLRYEGSELERQHTGDDDERPGEAGPRRDGPAEPLEPARAQPAAAADEKQRQQGEDDDEHLPRHVFDETGQEDDDRAQQTDHREVGGEQASRRPLRVRLGHGGRIPAFPLSPLPSSQPGAAQPDDGQRRGPAGSRHGGLGVRTPEAGHPRAPPVSADHRSR